MYLPIKAEFESDNVFKKHDNSSIYDLSAGLMTTIQDNIMGVYLLILVIYLLIVIYMSGPQNRRLWTAARRK